MLACARCTAPAARCPHSCQLRLGCATLAIPASGPLPQPQLLRLPGADECRYRGTRCAVPQQLRRGTKPSWGQRAWRVDCRVGRSGHCQRHIPHDRKANLGPAYHLGKALDRVDSAVRSVMTMCLQDARHHRTRAAEGVQRPRATSRGRRRHPRGRNNCMAGWAVDGGVAEALANQTSAA
jgi:hypothetical protein